MTMIYWAAVCYMLAGVTAMLGFGPPDVEWARAAFFPAAVGFIVLILTAWFRRWY